MSCYEPSSDAVLAAVRWHRWSHDYLGFWNALRARCPDVRQLRHARYINFYVRGLAGYFLTLDPQRFAPKFGMKRWDFEHVVETEAANLRHIVTSLPNWQGWTSGVVAVRPKSRADWRELLSAFLVCAERAGARIVQDPLIGRTARHPRFGSGVITGPLQPDGMVRISIEVPLSELDLEGSDRGVA